MWEFDKIAINARETMGGLFTANSCEMTHEDVVEALRKSYDKENINGY